MLPPLNMVAWWQNTAAIMLASGLEDNEYSVLLGDRCVSSYKMFEHASTLPTYTQLDANFKNPFH